MARLVLCQHCSRFFRDQEPACPFCTTVPLARTARRSFALPAGASRSQVYAAKLAVLASVTQFYACTDSTSSAQTTERDEVEETSDASADHSPNGAADDDAQPADDDVSSPGGPGRGDDDSEDPGREGGDDVGADDDARPNGGDGGGTVTANGGTPAGGAGSQMTANGGDGMGGSSATGGSATGGSATGGSATGGSATGHGGNGTTAAGETCPGYMEQAIDGPGCRSQADCESGRVCSASPVYEYAEGNPCRFGWYDCDPATCDGVCEPEPFGCGSVCATVCSADNCSGEFECVDDQCLLRHCDQEGARACSAGYACQPDDPTANAQGCVYLRCDQPGANACAEHYRCDPDEGDAVTGCVHLRCDEEGGFECQGVLGCKPEAALADVWGCAPLECDEPGGPSCPEGLACRPDDPKALSNAGAAGCAYVQCDEPGGPDCGVDGSCSPSAANASAQGCIPTPCDAGYSCAPFRKCDLDDPASDSHGCAPWACTTDSDCGCGFCFNEVCVPVEPVCQIPELVATPYGCVWPDDEFV